MDEKCANCKQSQGSSCGGVISPTLKKKKKHVRFKRNCLCIRHATTERRKVLRLRGGKPELRPRQTISLSLDQKLFQVRRPNPHMGVCFLFQHNRLDGFVI